MRIFSFSTGTIVAGNLWFRSIILSYIIIVRPVFTARLLVVPMYLDNFELCASLGIGPIVVVGVEALLVALGLQG